MDQKRNSDSYPGFKQLVDFVGKEVDQVTDPIYGSAQFNVGFESDVRQTVKHTSSFITNTDAGRRPPSPLCVLCGQSHRLFLLRHF